MLIFVSGCPVYVHDAVNEWNWPPYFTTTVAQDGTSLKRCSRMLVPRMRCKLILHVQDKKISHKKKIIS